MTHFDHRVYVYVSVETTGQRRYTLSRRVQLPTWQDITTRARTMTAGVQATWQLTVIGLKSLAWALGGKPWRKTLAENYGGTF